MKAKDVARIFEEIAPISSGILVDELGFIHGSPDVEVTGVGCTWCAHVASLQTCARHNLNMIICHEALWVRAQSSPWYDGPDEGHVSVNLLRRGVLDQSGAVVYRSHSNWDALPQFGIVDSAFAALKLDETREVARQKYFRIHEMAHSLSIEELRQRVEQGLGFPQCRIFGDPKARIRRFAFLVGGFGENQHHMPQAAMELGAEAIIIGEMSEFIVLACLDMGLPVIESLHSASEIPGVRNQARVMAERLHPLRVEYVPSGAAVQWEPGRL